MPPPHAGAGLSPDALSSLQQAQVHECYKTLLLVSLCKTEFAWPRLYTRFRDR
jgi:hypothetical protein